jgi:hypothetical protein
MKKITLLALSFLSLSAFARELYPEENVLLPSKAYKIEILKDIKMTDRRDRIIFVNGNIVTNVPKVKNLFYCELSNARSDGEIISVKKGAIFRFSDSEGFNWEHYVTGRIWRQRYMFYDNDLVQSFSCDDTVAYFHEIPSEGVIYKNIKKAVGRYLRITINQ